ncbi:MAG: nuclear transport factor 2 family protein [Pyrinomonadaceae bacterium]
MKRIHLIALLSVATFLLPACQPTANAPTTNDSNSANTNTSKPAPPPTKEALLARETKAFEAWKNHDRKYFEDFLADNFVGFGPGGRVTRSAAIAAIVDPACTVKTFSLSEVQMTPAGADAAVLTEKATQDYTCGSSKGDPVTWAATVYVRAGDQWKAIYHNEVPVGGSKSKSTPPASTEAAENQASDPVTNELLATEKKAWEAWKSRDAKNMEPIIANDFVLLDPTGRRNDRAGAFKFWFEPKCAVSSVALSDASGTSLGKDAGLLTFKGTAVGNCEGFALTALWGTTVYVKKGDSWKAVLIIEQQV